ncbi:hypothetical protein Tco_1211408 [Tanacetum coccineum]
MESSTRENDQSDLWSNQQHWKIITWRLYEACGVCILELKDGIVIHMLVERRYPLSKDLLQRMLDLGLEVKRESTVALDLIRFIKQQIDEEVLNSPCFMVKIWLVQDQTVLGKDYSNLLIADSLLKTIWFINAPCYGNEALASPKANGIFRIAYSILKKVSPVVYMINFILATTLNKVVMHRRKSENKGIVLTEMELVLEQTQQGTSYEVSVDPHGFEGIFKDGDGGT